MTKLHIIGQAIDFQRIGDLADRAYFAVQIADQDQFGTQAQQNQLLTRRQRRASEHLHDLLGQSARHLWSGFAIEPRGRQDQADDNCQARKDIYKHLYGAS